uniref:SFRICE_035559 n=1 Tax=Spodoptera frugiperda TaxID=7108 RepID=A0A2H1W973_SPOFR
MESSVEKQIQRIKMHEQDNEIKLREKRELNNAIVSTNRGIRDSLAHLGKLCKEYQYLITTTDKLVHQVAVEKLRLTALTTEVHNYVKELKELHNISNDGVWSVWNNRSELLMRIEDIANKCDIWPLLIKPSHKEIFPDIKPHKNTEKSILDKDKLRNALERRRKAQEKRNYLLSEPELGEEFIRIKNALQYSMEVAANAMEHRAELNHLN